MKKYSKIRLGLTGNGSQVTPSNQRAVTYDEESWKPTPEETSSKEKSPEPSTSSSSTSSKQTSKTKKVKKYLKKCKNALGTSKSYSSFDSKSSWYVDPRLENLVCESEINELEEVFEDAVVVKPLEIHERVKFEVASVIQVKGPPNEKDDNKEPEDINSTKDIASGSFDHFESALNSLQSEATITSEDCDFFSLEETLYDETSFKHKQIVLESFRQDIAMGGNKLSKCNISENRSQQSEGAFLEKRTSVDQGGGEVFCNSESKKNIEKSDINSVSPFLRNEQEEVEDGVSKIVRRKVEDGSEEKEGITVSNNLHKSEVEALVEKYFGDIYSNFAGSKKCLIRQARDLLVCEYHGCFNKFENEFCVQASKLLQHLKVSENTYINLVIPSILF